MRLRVQCSTAAAPIRGLLLVGVLGWFPAIIAADDRSREVDAIFGEVAASDGPGGVCVVIQGGRIVHQGLYGMADVERGTRFTLDTVVDLASVSKQFTGLAAAILVRRGNLSFQDEARKYLPELRVGDPKRPILVRHIASMTSGLTSYMDLLDDWAGHTNDDIARRVGVEELDFPTGTRYEYSNTDYNLLATIVQRAAKKKFGEFLRDEVFVPCGMKRTTVLERADQRIPDRAVGYRQDDAGNWVRDFDDTPGIVGDGCVFTCAADLVRYDAALRAKEVFDPETLELWATPGKLDSGKALSYALGLEIDALEGHPRMQHGGSWNGVSTFLARYLDDDLTVMVLLNRSDGDAEELGDRAASIYLGVKSEEDE